ncbi:ATP-grasp fold amidoligase family protein [Limimaricola cinnabarinus]|uniref:ATP-grasp fold amidoligase family protein n=1 Tax=Limimaricola cinnabarinus TaxID=1125964 RepID=UPI002FDF9A09
MDKGLSWESLKESVDSYIKKMQVARDAYLPLIQRINSSTDEERKNKLRYLLSSLNPDHIHHRGNVIKLAKHYDAGVSFRCLLSNHKIKKKYISSMGVEVTPDANSKIKDSRVYQTFGVKSPSVLCLTNSLDEIKKFPECVVKSQEGSSARGVFIKKNDDLYHVFDGKTFSQIDFYDEWLKNSSKDYIVEELVSYKGGPARDIKAYCFYGVVGLVLEVDRSSGRAKYCEFNRDGSILETGRYTEDRFLGSVFSNEVVKVAERVSRNIPSPFVRLDFLMSDDGIFGGEITANPGSFHLFNGHENRRLGIEFIKAEARLFSDLIKGKSFQRYFEAVSC